MTAVERRALAALLLLGPLAATASAQSKPPAVAIRGFADTGYQSFHATRTFMAIFREDAGPVFGGGGEIVMGRGIFARVGAWRYENTGERALRLEGQVFRLGIPLTITIVPIEASGGYRFRRSARLVPYGGGGVSRYSYRERSDFAASGENVDERFTGYQVFGGVEYRLARWIAAAAEVQYVTVPDSLGAGGLSAEFNEDDLGGRAIRVRFVVGR